MSDTWPWPRWRRVSREARHVRRREGRVPRRRGDRRARRADDARVVRARRRGRDRRADAARRGEAARADRAEEVLPHGRQLPRARGGVEERQLDAPDRALDQLLPERRRDHRAGRADRLSRAPDRGARLRARARRRPQEGGQVVLAGGGRGLHRRLRDLQRHHRPRHPARRDALGRVQLLQGDRHLLPARAVDRDAGRDPRPARPRDGAARQRRAAAGVEHEPHERDDPGDPQQLLGARLQRGRRPLDRHRRGVAGFKSEEERRRLYLKPGDVVEAEIERIGVLRNPVDLVAGGPRRAGAAAHPPLGRLRDLARATTRSSTASARSWRRRSSTRSSSARPTTSST